MLARTKMPHTDNNNSPSHKAKGWKSLFEKELECHSEQGLYLKGLRLREGFTQAELGKLIGVSQNNVSAMEKGSRLIGKTVAQRIAKVFNVNYQRFL